MSTATTVWTTGANYTKHAVDCTHLLEGQSADGALFLSTEAAYLRQAS